MCRVQKLLAALTDIIVIYHAHQFKCTDYQDSNAIVENVIALKTSHGDEEDEIVNLSIQYDDKKEADLQKLIGDIVSKDTKRQTLLQYVLDTISLIRPLVITPKLLEENEQIAIQEHLTQFISTLQCLFNTQAPATIVVNYANKETVAICGFLNELKDGGGFCTSGSIIKEKLLVPLFPCFFSAVPATIESIKQTVSDILRDQQIVLLLQQKEALLTINEQLRGNIEQLNNKLFNLNEVESFTQESIFPSKLFSFPNYPFWQQPNIIKKEHKENKNEEETDTVSGVNFAFEQQFYYDG
jgi:hypothetical protein